MSHEPPSEQLVSALRWALDATASPATASADWLASDIRPECASALALLTDDETSIPQLRKAKNVFKTMRIVGESREDRQVGARLYAASIAAALVRFDERISRQSDRALRRGFVALVDDPIMPEAIQELAGQALCWLDQQGRQRPGSPPAD